MEAKKLVALLFVALSCFVMQGRALAQNSVIPNEVAEVIKGVLPPTVPENVAKVIRGEVVGQVSAQQLNQPAPYICRNAEPIDGVKTIVIPKIGAVAAYSTTIEKPVDGYWKEYRATTGVPKSAWGAYIDAVEGLNPQIPDIDRICKGYRIRLPYPKKVEATAALPIQTNVPQATGQNQGNSALHEKLTEQSATLDLITARLVEMQGYLKVVVEKQSNLHGKIEEQTVALRTMDERVTELERDVENKDEQLKEQAESLRVADEKVEEMQNVLKTVVDEQVSLKNRLAISEENVVNLQTALDSVSRRSSTLTVIVVISAVLNVLMLAVMFLYRKSTVATV